MDSDTFTPRDVLGKTLAEARQQFRLSPAISTAAPAFLDKALGLLFPHLSHSAICNPAGVETEVASLELDARVLLSYLPDMGKEDVAKVVAAFVDQLPNVYRLLLLDAEAIYSNDPAAESLDEVIVAYPGFYAIAVYRLAHVLYELQVPLVPRLLAECSHKRTGIDIHPGAKIGESFFIDHGTGIVVGETCEIGNNVKIYQGVTLGALQVSRSLRYKKRHPTIGDNVVIYAGATILGGQTVVGRDTVVGGNVWLTESVPPESVVAHKSEVRVRTNGHSDPLIEFQI